MHWRRKWQPVPVFLPGEYQGRRSLVGCRLWGLTESDTTEVSRQKQQQQQRIHVSATLSICPTLFLPCCVCKSILYVYVLPCPGNRFISTIFLDSMYMMFDYVWLIYLFFSFCINSIQQALDSFTSLWLTQIHSFFWWVIIHYIYVPQLLSLFICCWTSRLLPCPGYCKKCCSVNWDTCDFFNYGFLRYMPSSGIAERFIPSLLRNIHTVFQNGYINLHPHQQCGGFHILCSIYCL